MSAVRIALLDPSGTEHTRRNFRRELDAELVEFNVQAGQLPETFQYDGCIVTGSSSSVYWDESWLPAMRSWLAEAIEHDMPILGVCYGHQLVADVLGGTVEDMGEYELGYQTVRHDGSSVLLDGVSEEFLVFTSHSDRVADLPPGATQFAENRYGIHGFRHGRVFGVQFHPEYDQETATEVTKEKEIPDEQRAAVLAGINDDNYATACEAKQLFTNFVDFVAERRASVAVE